MRYASTVAEERRAEETFRNYMADSVRAVYGINVRYSDLLTVPDDYDANDVIEDVISRAGLEVVG